MKYEEQTMSGTPFTAAEQQIQHIVHRTEMAFDLLIGGCLGAAALILLRLLWM